MATVRKTALIASAPEQEFSFCNPFTGISFFSEAVERALAQLRNKSNVSFEDFSAAILGQKSCLLNAFSSPGGEFVGIISGPLLSVSERLLRRRSAQHFGSILQVATTPPNNHFTNRIQVAGMPLTVLGSNVGASKEPGEPTMPTLREELQCGIRGQRLRPYPST